MGKQINMLGCAEALPQQNVGKLEARFVKVNGKHKNGFLLVELMMGLVISIFFILIITHYIIEVRSTQQKAMKKIENFSTERNKSEKFLSQK